MSKRYRELMRERAGIERDFTAHKLEYLEAKARAHMDWEDNRISTATLERDLEQMEIGYTSLKLENIDKKNRVEEQIADEIDNMNRTAREDGKPAVFRADGKIDFGKAFLYLADRIEEMSDKIKQMDRILVENP